MRTIGSMHRFTACLGFACVAMLATGCTAVPSLPAWPESLPVWPAKKEVATAPRSLAVVWTSAVLQRTGSTPTRGFGGLVTFYGADPNTTLKVEGQLTVYAYHDSAGAGDKVAPDAKYIFPAEQLANHYGPSGLGHSYSIWIPWDRAGGPRQELTLTACFQPVDGELVLGMPARVVLEGAPNTRRQEAEIAAPGFSPVTRRRGGTHADAAPALPAPKLPPREMTTTTLSLPRSVER